MVFSFWPFCKKPPLLHRSIGREHKEQNRIDDDDVEEEESDGLVKPKRRQRPLKSVEELATQHRVRKKDSFHRNALHIACLYQPTLERIMFLHELYPRGITETDKVGRLPLHTACANQASLDVIRYLIEQDPESIFDVTDRGTNALFCAIENHASLDVIQYLIFKDPGAVTLPEYKLGKTPVHAAAARGQSIEVLRYLLRQRPNATAELDAWGKTPLACACADPTVAVETMEFLIDGSAISTPDRAGMFPLHIAAANNASQTIEILQILLEEWPAAITETDRNGRLPIHAACTNPRISVAVLEFIGKAYPQGYKTFDKYGNLPLHLAIARKLPNEVLDYLMEVCPGAVRTREASNKMYPLHLAVKYGVSDLDIIRKIMTIWPEAISSPDKNSNTVFHHACECRQIDVPLCELLLVHCDPNDLCKPNDQGSLPLHLACQYRAPWPVMKLLIDEYPEALVTKDGKGNVPLHKAFQTITELPVLVRIAHADYHALYKRNQRGLAPTDCCANEKFHKRFRRGLYWYNLRSAYCPICIRQK
jgi:ankyrin repeat protein